MMLATDGCRQLRFISVVSLWRSAQTGFRLVLELGRLLYTALWLVDTSCSKRGSAEAQVKHIHTDRRRLYIHTKRKSRDFLDAPSVDWLKAPKPRSAPGCRISTAHSLHQNRAGPKRSRLTAECRGRFRTSRNPTFSTSTGYCLKPLYPKLS
jgi:hypothetical protein